MGLLSAVLGLLLRKAGAFLALVLSLFVGYLLVQAAVPALRDAAAERERLERVSEERAALEREAADLQATVDEGLSERVALLQPTLALEVSEVRAAVVDQQSTIASLREKEREVCGTVEKIVSFVMPGDACGDAQKALEQGLATLDTLETNLGRAEDAVAVLRDDSLSDSEKLDRVGEQTGQSSAEREAENTAAELAQKRAEEASLESAQDSWAGFVVEQWSRSWRTVLGIAALVLLLPPLLRTVSYFVLMPALSRVQRQIRLADGDEAELGLLTTSPARRTLEVVLGDGEVLAARSEHVRPVQGRVRSRLLYDWSAPFVSFAAGLYFLTRVTGDESSTAATLAPPEDPDSYLMRLDFEDHPGVVMHPRHVVGVIGRPTLSTQWRWGLHSLATWQVRYILFGGTGSLIVQGCGDVVGTNPRGRALKMEKHLLMGFDSRLTLGVRRTEVFWPYLRGKTPLIDDEFTGSHSLFWQKSSTQGASNPLARTFNAFFSGLGKLLGF